MTSNAAAAAVDTGARPGGTEVNPLRTGLVAGAVALAGALGGAAIGAVTGRLFGKAAGLVTGGAIAGASLLAAKSLWDAGQGQTRAEALIGRARGIPPLQFTPVASGFDSPISVTFAPGDHRMYVVERAGRVIAADEAVNKQTFLDISPIVSTNSSERGLLSLAFHPDYERNGKLYVDFTDLNGHTSIREFHATGGVVDAGEGREIFHEPHPYDWHYSGQLQFGRDGLLYIGLGDGGGGGDPENRAQDITQPHGKILRIDVDHPDPKSGRAYSIPAGNPYVDEPGARPEIWASGLRNPWRFSFDRANGDLYVADVGQNIYEEINHVAAGAPAGANFGWDLAEASHPFENTPQGPGHVVDPFLEYAHDARHVAVIGGYVYRGSDNPALQGYYLYTDLAADKVTAVRVEQGRAVDKVEIPEDGLIVGFGQDAQGEIYGASLNGSIYRLAPA